MIIMRSRRLTRIGESLKRKWTALAIQMFTLSYLSFLIVVQLTSPTTAHFNDIESARSTLSAAEDFGEHQKEAAKDSDGEPDNHQEPETEDQKRGDRQKETNRIDKWKDKKAAKQTRKQKKSNTSSTEQVGHNETKETEATNDQTVKTSDSSSKADSGKAKEETKNVEE